MGLVEVIDEVNENSFDSIQPVLNIVQANDLERILALTPSDRKWDVALAFTGLTQRGIAKRTGLGSVNVMRWLNNDHKMPLGAAFRIARCFGVSPDLLLEEFILRADKNYFEKLS